MENRLHQRSRNDKAWSQRTTFHDDDIRDDEHATSAAAAAFAIYSLEEAKLRNLQKMREGPKSSRTQTMRRKEDKISRRPSYGETSMKRSFGQDPRTTESAFPVRRPSGISSPRPVSPAAGYQKQKVIPIQHKNVKTRPETWEKAQIEKIQKWYEKIMSKILSWERVKKIQAKLQVERKKVCLNSFLGVLYFKFVNLVSLLAELQRALDHRREMEMQNYQNRIARVDMIAQRARAQLEGKRRKEEFEAREKASKIQKTGKIPVKCLCFNS